MYTDRGGAREQNEVRRNVCDEDANEPARATFSRRPQAPPLKMPIGELLAEVNLCASGKCRSEVIRAHLGPARGSVCVRTGQGAIRASLKVSFVTRRRRGSHQDGLSQKFPQG